jgi:predicted TIM-barrel fold metal-dependent hydrolase
VIVDAHAHLGNDEVFDVDFTADDLLGAQEANGIDVTLVQPATAHDLDTVRRYHDAIADLAARHPGRFAGIANPNPHLPPDAYEREVRRCVEELGFVGIKLHPTAHAVNPVGRAGRRVFALAAGLRMPVMVHTGAGIPWAAPSLLQPIAEEHPHVPLIVAHGGGMILAQEAAQLAQRHKQVYLECSWLGGFLIRSWVRSLGPERILFGSDHADNAAAELAKFRSLGLTEDELHWCLGATAARVFGLGHDATRHSS